MLSIEIFEGESHGHRSYHHSVVIESTVTDPDIYQRFIDQIENHPNVSVMVEVIKPGDDVYGGIAVYWQVIFYAVHDMSEWLDRLASVIIDEDEDTEGIITK